MFLAGTKLTDMFQRLFLVLICLVTHFCFAQKERKEPVPDSLKTWFIKGKSTLLFNQAAFNKDFATGGVNSLAFDVNGTFEVNFDDAHWRWDNKIAVAYGIAKITDEDFQKTNDQFQYNSLVGLRASKNWDYSFITQLRTQFADGRKGVKTELSNSDGVRRSVILEGEKNSKFFSPAFLEFGPGMSWKKGDNNNFKFNLAPATSKMIFVASRFTEEEENFGVEQGENFRYELGASAQGYAKVKLFKNVTWENILKLYSNYLEDAQNIDLDYLSNLVIRVNEYITSNLTFQTLYDDNTTRAFQVRESFGIGFNYGF